MRLALLSKKAHECAARGGLANDRALAEIEQEIDELSSKLWELSIQELEQMRSGLEISSTPKKSPQFFSQKRDLPKPMWRDERLNKSDHESQFANLLN